MSLVFAIAVLVAVAAPAVPLPPVVAAAVAVPAAQETPRARLDAAIKAAREAETLTYRYALKTEIPMSDPFEANGRGVTGPERLLFLDVKGTGGIDKKMIVTPRGTLIWHAFLDDWVTAEEYGDPDAGRGFQNPHDLLEVIAGATAGATDGEGGAVRLRFEGKAAIDLLGKLQIDARRLDADGTWSEMNVSFDGGRIKSLHSNAHINFVEDPNAAQQIDSFEYDVKVDVDAYDRDKKPSWEGIDVDAALKSLAAPKK